MGILIEERPSPVGPAGRHESPHRSLADCLCEEHKALAREIALLRSVADEIRDRPPEAVRSDVDRAYVLLAQKVLPHAKAERAFCTRLAMHDYRPVDTDYQQVEMGRLARRLGALKPRLGARKAEGARDEIREILYELHTLARLHFADELVAGEHAAEER